MKECVVAVLQKQTKPVTVYLLREKTRYLSDTENPDKLRFVWQLKNCEKYDTL